MQDETAQEPEPLSGPHEQAVGVETDPSVLAGDTTETEAPAPVVADPNPEPPVDEPAPPESNMPGFPQPRS